MGCDIHFYVEQKHKNGEWYCMWSSSLQYTAWYTSRFLEPGNHKPYSDPHGTNAYRSRNYEVFTALSGSDMGRGHNFLDQEGFGTSQNGVLTTGWPEDISRAMYENRDDVDYHTHGHITLAQVKELKDKITNHDWGDSRGAAEHQSAVLLGWLTQAAKVEKQFCAPDGMLGIIVGKEPDEEEYDDPNYPIQDMGSAHTTLANKSGQLWDGLLTGDDNIRILICYDN